MQSEMDFKVPGALDVAPLPSAARLAAEAFFTPAVAIAPQAPVAPAVVWRKKAIAKPVSPDASANPTPIDGGRRAPRVFTVKPAALEPQEAPSPTPSQPPTIAGVVASLPEHPAVAPLRRRKRRQLHGDVRIIRPLQDEAPRQTDADRPLPAGATISDGRPAPATAPRERRGASLRPRDEARPSYRKLLARIRLLQAEAERARQREAAAAIEWMKRDIALYGLTAEDLGFR
jgi:hypothetical protein